jgi:putative ABC transport system permease protein
VAAANQAWLLKTARCLSTNLPLAAAGSLASSKFLLGVHPLDPVAFLAVTVFLGLVGAAASYLPARRATRVDPLMALRYE